MIAAAVLLAGSPALGQGGDEKAVCLAMHEEAQVARQEGRLRAARGALLACARSSCPSLLRADCASWLDALVQEIPSVVISAESGRGDEADVRVLIDGQVVAEALDGKELEVDPGKHVFRFELPPHAPIERTLLIRERERGRPVSIFFGERHAAAPPPPPVSARPTTEAAPEGARPVPLAVYVLGGSALVAAGLFAGVGASGMAERRSLQESCAPFCGEAQVQSVRTRFLIADLALAAGAGAAVSAGLLFWLRPTVPSREADRPAAAPVAVVPVARGALVQLRGAL
ncbi:hypothetical protein [Sorangium sp. So ce1389]|uniref:hypothetical protein n=1 Tax=Sorangium sp. So ce1389 TaxID=3133336 RepID=UPI003F606F19